jgi:hypothetical protein
MAVRLRVLRQWWYLYLLVALVVMLVAYPMMATIVRPPVRLRRL